MPTLGNAWYVPSNPEPRGWGGMLDPVGPILPGTHVTIISGNQLQDGSVVFVRHGGDSG